MFVFGPSIANASSASARRTIACSRVSARAITFAIIGS